MGIQFAWFASPAPDQVEGRPCARARFRGEEIWIPVPDQVEDRLFAGMTGAVGEAHPIHERLPAVKQAYVFVRFFFVCQ